MTANVRIVTDQRDNVLKVPNAALRFRPAGVTNGKDEPAPVAAAPGPGAGRATRRPAGNGWSRSSSSTPRSRRAWTRSSRSCATG